MKQNLLQNCRKAVRRSLERFRSFPKISEDYQRFPRRILKIFELTVHSSLKQGKDVSKRDVIDQHSHVKDISFTA